MARKRSKAKRRVRMYRRGKTWWLGFSRDGRRCRVSTKETIKERAELARDALEVKLFEDPWFDPKRRCDCTFAEFVPRFLEWSKANKRSHRCDRTLTRNLSAHFGPKLLDRIGPADVEAYKARRLSGDLLFGDPPRKASRSTINRELSRLRRVLSLAVEWGELAENPLAGKLRLFPEPEGRVRYLSAEQAELLLSKCAEHVRPVVLLAMLTGMRKTEASALQWSEVDLARGVIRLPGTRTKNGRARNVPLSAQARALLRVQHDKCPGGCPFVFWRAPLRRRDKVVTRGWEPLGNIRKGFEGACRRAHRACVEAREREGLRPAPSGFEGLRFHDLRHHFASALAQRGVPLQAVGELLGHRTLAMTQRYSHLSPQVLQGAVEQASKYLGGERAEAEPAALSVLESTG